MTPTADMPAPVSEVTVSGVIRARALYLANRTRFLDDGHAKDDGANVDARGRLVVEGKTETAVGEVGGTIRLEGTYDDDHQSQDYLGAAINGFNDDAEDVDMDIAWGYWQMTPMFQLGGGYTASTGSLQAGVDWQHNDDMTGGVNAFSNADNEQVRITFQSGGLTLAVAVEDNDAENSTDTSLGDAEGEIPEIAGYGLVRHGFVRPRGGRQLGSGRAHRPLR